MEIFKQKEIEVLRFQYDWIEDMFNTSQDEEHHGEGNVGIHTNMVINALESDWEYRQLNGDEREILWTAALLHDVEKRTTTIHQDGRIVSPGHAKKGALTSRKILFRDLGVSFVIREKIVGLVRYHGLPIWCMEKPNPKKAILQSAIHVDTHLLYLLAKADAIGRICKDKHILLEKIEFFKEYCLELGCYGQQPCFPNSYSRFKYFQSEQNEVYDVFDDTVCKVYLMCGLPGMGKDSYIKKNFADLSVISLDALRQKHKIKKHDTEANGWIAQLAKEEARTFLRQKQSFVWNATNITKQLRSQLIDLFCTYKAKVQIIYIEQSYYELWKKQNANREAIVPESVLDKMLNKLEVPTLDEAEEIVYIVS